MSNRFRAPFTLLILNLSFVAAFAQSHSLTSTPMRASAAEEEGVRAYWAGFVLVGDGG